MPCNTYPLQEGSATAVGAPNLELGSQENVEKSITHNDGGNILLRTVHHQKRGADEEESTCHATLDS